MFYNLATAFTFPRSQCVGTFLGDGLLTRTFFDFFLETNYALLLFAPLMSDLIVESNEDERSPHFTS
jgi:hypothetical protein